MSSVLITSPWCVWEAREHELGKIGQWSPRQDKDGVCTEKILAGRGDCRSQDPVSEGTRKGYLECRQPWVEEAAI